MSGGENKAVFLSYASQDADAARKICESLRASGVEVWFDADGGLEHGDEWDAKIRKQIKECVLFIPIISANTEARHEGYFRLEWDLAAERARTIASGIAFILPVVIDDTREPEALVPDRFRAVQWTKLKGGAVPAEVKARFLKLWSHRAGALRVGDRGQVSGDTGVGTEDKSANVSPVSRRLSPVSRWLAPAILGAVGCAALAAWWLNSGVRSTVSNSKLRTSNAEASATAPLSEARQLARRARALWAEERTRDRLGAAEELGQKALALDATDPEVLATLAQIDAFMIYYGYDIAEERRQRAQKYAARALTLAPAAAESRHAQAVVAGFLIHTPEMMRESIDLYRALLRGQPADRVLGFELGLVLEDGRRFDEAAAAFEQAGDRLSTGRCYFEARRLAEARNVVEQSLAARRTVAGLLLKGRIELYGFEDLDAAEATLAQLTATELQVDEAAMLRSELHLLRRESAPLLRVLEAFPNSFLSVAGNHYPKQYLTGYAHELAGRHDAAQVEWRSALRAVEERLRSKPNDWFELGWQACLRALLGEKAAAESALRLYADYKSLGPQDFDFFTALTLLQCGRQNEPLAMLSGYLRKQPSSWEWGYAHTFARYSVELDPLRTDLRFDALIRETLPAGAKPFAAAADAKSVAVLAFENLSGDKDNEYFSDGISEELLNVLAKVPGLRVVGRTSAFYFKGRNASAQEIGQKLGAGHLVEGSVQKAGMKVRIRARLTKAETGEQMWSESYEEELKDVFALQDRIARGIARTLQIMVAPEPMTEDRSANPEAYRLCLEARSHYLKLTIASLSEAERLFQRALALQPHYERALTGLADVWLRRGVLAAVAKRYIERELTTANDFARRAIQIAPNAVEPHRILAEISSLEGRIADAEKFYARARELKPDASTWGIHAFFLLRKGRPDLSIAEAVAVRGLVPLEVPPIHCHAIGLFATGRVNEALDVLKTTESFGVWNIGCSTEALFLARLGRTKEAVVKAREGLDLSGRPGTAPGFNAFSDGVAAWALVEAGALPEAEAAVLKLRNGPPERRFNASLALLKLGRIDEATELMRDYAQGNLFYCIFLCAEDSKLRHDRRVRAVFGELNALEALEACSNLLDAGASPRPTPPTR